MHDHKCEAGLEYETRVSSVSPGYADGHAAMYPESRTSRELSDDLPDNPVGPQTEGHETSARDTDVARSSGSLTINAAMGDSSEAPRPTDPDRPGPLTTNIGSFGMSRTPAISELRRLPEIYARQIDSYRQALQHPHVYQLTVSLRSTDTPQVGVGDALGIFYGDARETRRQGVVYGARGVRASGLRLLNSDSTSPEAIVSDMRHIMNDVGTLVADMVRVQRAKATIFNFNNMSGPQRATATAALRQINSQEKPPVLAEYMRHFIPRFTWYPHGIPEGVPVPEDYAEQFHRNWSGYSVDRASYLIHPDQLAAGKAPFHKAFEAARTAEADGHPDLAYAIKAKLISDTIDMEHERFKGDVHVEIPIFEYLVPAAMSGQLTSGDKAHFNYVDAIIETIDETWGRIQKEIKQGEPGPATMFMYNLATFYRGDLDEYMALSLSRHAAHSTTDTAGLLGDMRAVGIPWADALIERVKALPERPLLTSQEFSDFAGSTARTDDNPPAINGVEDAAGRLLEGHDSDIYSVKSALSDVADVDSTSRATIAVDITRGEAQATINYRGNDAGYTFRVILSLHDGSVSVRTTDNASLDQATQDRYRTIISKAILEAAEADQADTNKAASVREPRRPTTTSVSSKAQHTQQRSTPKLKTRGTADPLMARQEDRQNERPQPPEQSYISGIDMNTVAIMLAEGRARQVDPEAATQKLEYLAERAAATGSSFGQRAPLVGIKGGDNIKLREIKWRTGSGQQLRFYFEEKPGGRLELCGINDKRGQTQHEAYLSRLVRRLRQRDAKTARK